MSRLGCISLLVVFGVVAHGVPGRGAQPLKAAVASQLGNLPHRFLAVLAQPTPLLAMQAAGSPKKKAAQPDIPLPEGKGHDQTKKLCGTCHSNNVWAVQRHDADKWSSIIDNMVSKGLEASDDDLAIVNDYLATNFAPAKKDPSAPAGAPAPAAVPPTR